MLGQIDGGDAAAGHGILCQSCADAWRLAMAAHPGVHPYALIRLHPPPASPTGPTTTSPAR